MRKRAYVEAIATLVTLITGFSVIAGWFPVKLPISIPHPLDIPATLTPATFSDFYWMFLWWAIAGISVPFVVAFLSIPEEDFWDAFLSKDSLGFIIASMGGSIFWWLFFRTPFFVSMLVSPCFWTLLMIGGYVWHVRISRRQKAPRRDHLNRASASAQYRRS